MKMEYVLNKEKILKDNKFSVEEIQSKLDNLMKKKSYH